MTRYEQVSDSLKAAPRTWLVTGAAGFIGSNLVESLLKLNQKVVGLDDFSTGHRHNLDLVREAVGADAWRRFTLIEGSICDNAVCARAVTGTDYVLHQAALGSVPRSIDKPLGSFAANVDGFIKILTAARDAGVRGFVYASSSSVYGDSPVLPKVEEQIGKPLSPYAATKYVDEVFAEVYARCYGFRSVGLRYFNVFGPRQDPEGAYAAVIPRWVARLLRGEPIQIYGDGETSRDFCYVSNAVQANILAAVEPGLDGAHHVFNVACREQTSLNQLFEAIRAALSQYRPELSSVKPVYTDFRKGDVRHSLADIGHAQEKLGYEPSHKVQQGLAQAMAWYMNRYGEMSAKKEKVSVS